LNVPAHQNESACPRFIPRPKPIRPQHLLLLQVQVDTDLFDKFAGQHLGEQSPVRRGAICRVTQRFSPDDQR